MAATAERFQRQSRRARGFSLIETMLAIGVLSIGVMSLVTLIPFATRNDYRSRIDTTATFVAMRELEQMTAQPFQLVTGFLDAQDGNGTSVRVSLSCSNWVNATTPPVAPVPPCDFGALVDANGNIDFTQNATAVPADFRRDYILTQSANNNTPKVNQGTYDVRWHVFYNANAVRTIVIAARPRGNWPGTTTFPANLRAVQMK